LSIVPSNLLLIRPTTRGHRERLVVEHRVDDLLRPSDLGDDGVNLAGFRGSLQAERKVELCRRQLDIGQRDAHDVRASGSTVAYA
jgi:hypothetical protein